MNLIKFLLFSVVAAVVLSKTCTKADVKLSNKGGFIGCGGMGKNYKPLVDKAMCAKKVGKAVSGPNNGVNHCAKEAQGTRMVSPTGTGGSKMFRYCIPCSCDNVQVNSKCPSPSGSPSGGSPSGSPSSGGGNVSPVQCPAGMSQQLCDASSVCVYDTATLTCMDFTCDMYDGDKKSCKKKGKNKGCTYDKKSTNAAGVKGMCKAVDCNTETDKKMRRKGGCGPLPVTPVACDTIVTGKKDCKSAGCNYDRKTDICS